VLYGDLIKEFTMTNDCEVCKGKTGDKPLTHDDCIYCKEKTLTYGTCKNHCSECHAIYSKSETWPTVKLSGKACSAGRL
jgi:hypothetical protein